MPTSKKRVKKPKEEITVAVKNPLHSTIGKVVVVALAAAFVLGTVVLLITTMISVLNK